MLTDLLARVPRLLVTRVTTLVVLPPVRAVTGEASWLVLAAHVWTWRRDTQTFVNVLAEPEVGLGCCFMFYNL